MFPLHFPVGAYSRSCFDRVQYCCCCWRRPSARCRAVWVQQQQQSRATGIIIHPPTPRNIRSRENGDEELSRDESICHPQQSVRRKSVIGTRSRRRQLRLNIAPLLSISVRAAIKRAVIQHLRTFAAARGGDKQARVADCNTQKCLCRAECAAVRG
jgi:hypothetical protein